MNDVMRYRVNPWLYHFYWYVAWAEHDLEYKLLQTHLAGH